MNSHSPHLRFRLMRLLACLAMAVAGSNAVAQQADPPARVATLSDIEGSVVFAPAGETEWSDAVRNRPITRGDRLWTDDKARAELHFGSAALHMDSGTFVDIVALDDDMLQLNVNEGTVNARLRQLQGGENFEIDTPQLAFRAMQPGDWRIDVDPARGFTRIAVHSGTAVVYGPGGGTLQLEPGQQVAFTGRNLAQLRNPPPQAGDGFERWAADRNRAEDQSIAARYVPRDVVGYQELDRYGSWAQDPGYGYVWYPQVTVADWAPYRYGHWDWIEPWGWTWVDDAPWGFAPFHYGRWTMIGSRWAWVPGPLGPRPAYAPALVAFVGGGGFSLSAGSGPGIGWYPLAPGEVWRPFFTASPVYVRNVNRYLVRDSRYYNTGPHFFLRRSDAITAVRVDDFHRGREVQRHWTRVSPADVARAQPVMPPAPRSEGRRAFEPARPSQLRAQSLLVESQLRPQMPAQAPSPVRRAAPPVAAARPQPPIEQGRQIRQQHAEQHVQRQQQRAAAVQQRGAQRDVRRAQHAQPRQVERPHGEQRAEAEHGRARGHRPE
jgi:hypothetical protein